MDPQRPGVCRGPTGAPGSAVRAGDGRDTAGDTAGTGTGSLLQPGEEFVMHRTQTCIRAGKCYRFMRRVIKNVSKRLVKLMVQVNCMK